MAEEAAATDLISGGRLQLGISRGSPEPALRGYEAFGYVPADGRDGCRRRARAHRAVPRRDRRRRRRLAEPADDAAAARRWRSSRSRPASPTASGGVPAPARPRSWTAEQGMNLMSSTLLTEDTGVPFDELQAEQIAMYRAAWAEAGLGARAARVGEPQHPADHDRRGPRVLRPLAAGERRTRSATSTAGSPASARATSASPT